MYYECRDVETSEVIFIDTDSELKVGNVFRHEGRAYEVTKEYDPKSEEAERIPCDRLKRIPHVK